MRVLAFCLAIGIAFSLNGSSQTPSGSANIALEVVSIRPHQPGQEGGGWQWNATGFVLESSTLQELIGAANQVDFHHVEGLPAWATETQWDIRAKTTAESARPDEFSRAQRATAVASILKERFGVITHTVQREVPVFRLIVAPGGLKMKKSPALPPGGDAAMHGIVAPDRIQTTRTSMQTLGGILSSAADRPVLDETGLQGVYDVNLRWTSEMQTNVAKEGGAEDVPPLLSTALTEQLGLKLIPAKVPMPFVVVDHIQKPAGN